jgi:hypothetical protein
LIEDHLQWFPLRALVRSPLMPFIHVKYKKLSTKYYILVRYNSPKQRLYICLTPSNILFSRVNNIAIVSDNTKSVISDKYLRYNI